MLQLDGSILEVPPSRQNAIYGDSDRENEDYDQYLTDTEHSSEEDNFSVAEGSSCNSTENMARPLIHVNQENHNEDSGEINMTEIGL